MVRYRKLTGELCSGLQEYARAYDKISYFLTYADNNAVGYFAKQGFTKEITLEKEKVIQTAVIAIPSCVLDEPAYISINVAMVLSKAPLKPWAPGAVVWVHQGL